MLETNLSHLSTNNDKQDNLIGKQDLDGDKSPPSRLRQWAMLVLSFVFIGLFIAFVGTVMKPWLIANSPMMAKMYQEIEDREINTAGYDYTDTEQTEDKSIYFDHLKETIEKETLLHVSAVIFCIGTMWIGLKYMPLD